MRSIAALKGGVPLIFELGGLALIATGCFLLAPVLGFIVAGVALFGVGWAMDGRR